MDSLIAWIRWEVDGWLEEHPEVDELAVQDVLTWRFTLLEMRVNMEGTP